MRDLVPPLSNEMIVLASGSATRATMLRQAGVAFQVDAPGVDEGEIRDSLLAEDAKGHEIAEMLAEVKALRVSRRHGPRFVLGADQTLSCEGKVFSKPADRAAAFHQLTKLSGRTHELASAAVIARRCRHLAPS